jgi:hypothetical protein
MPFSYNYTTISSCDATTGWTNDGFDTWEAGGDFTDNRREGTNLIEFAESTIGWQSAAYDLGGTSTFDLTENDVHFWFYYTAKGEQVLASSGSVVLRVYSAATRGTNYAEWDLSGHVNEALYPPLLASWNKFLISGDNPTRVGAGGAPTYTAIRWIEMRYDFAASNENQGDPDLGIDWFKYGNTITVQGGTSGTPENFVNLQTWDDRAAATADIADDPHYGLVESADVFVELWAGMQIGSGASSTYFAAENYFIYNRAFSQTVAHDWRVQNNATLRLGKKDIGTQATYAINGCQLVCPNVTIDQEPASSSHNSNFIVESGGTFLGYATKLYRWKDIWFGDASGSADDVDLIDCDFDDNNNIEFRSSTLKVKNSKFHDPAGSGYVGSIYIAPQSLEGIQVFNCERAFHFKASVTVSNYIATDNTYDLVIDDGLTVTLINSTFDPDKILQV